MRRIDAPVQVAAVSAAQITSRYSGSLSFERLRTSKISSVWPTSVSLCLITDLRRSFQVLFTDRKLRCGRPVAGDEIPDITNLVEIPARYYLRDSFPSFEKTAQNLLDAAIDPTLWSAALAGMASFADATGVALLHTSNIRIGAPYSPSMAEAVDGYFSEGWHLRDDRIRGVPFMRRNGYCIDQDFVGQDELRTSPYYQHLRKFKTNWSVGIGVSSADEEMVLLILFGDRHGYVERKEARELMRWRPHIEAAAALSKNIVFAHASGMVDAYQSLGCPSLLLDHAGAVIRLNEAAERLIGDGLKLHMGRLQCERADDTQALRTLIDQVCHSATSTQDILARVVVRRAFKSPLVIEGIRVGGMTSDAFSSARAVLLISDSGRDLAPTPTALMREVFGLTAAEAVLVGHLEQGLALQTAADAMHITIQTARTHLKRILFKTQTGRQSEMLLAIRRLRQAP